MKLITFILFLSLCYLGQAQDTIRTYYNTDQTQLKTVHCVQSQGTGKMYHGAFSVFYPNQSIKSSGNYSLGQLHGDYSEYSKSGTLILKCRYTNGILNGEHKSYYESGNIQERKLYINGKLQGDRKYFPDQKDATPNKIEKYQMGSKL